MVNSTPQHDADPEQTLSEEDNDTEMDISGYDLEQEELSNALRDEARNYNQTRLRGDTPEAYQFSYEPLPPRLPPPTEQLHRVYVLNCAHCQTFLSDRGMKAVLLLKPSITLFSTDAHPTHSGPQYGNEAAGAESIERTCDCLTQSLGCYGCGITIGYHIVSPCAKCTQSVSHHRSSANGHRFVFHAGEVHARERKYFKGEAGILAQYKQPDIKVTLPGRTRLTSNPSRVMRRRSDTLCHDLDPEETASRVTSQGGWTVQLPVPRRQRCLKEGDSVYWHHLKHSGERVRPMDPDAYRRRGPICGR